MGKVRSGRVCLWACVAAVVAGICIRVVTKQSAPEAEYIRLQGQVFHTIYHITYRDTARYEREIRELFDRFDGSMSMFNDTSVISRMNRNDTSVVADHYFRTVFEKALTVSERTGGAFDMTVAPLVNLWGFGVNARTDVDASRVDSILEYVGYRKVRLDSAGHLVKDDPRTILDASSIAKGYMCDVLADFLQSRGVSDYMVEIGGEIALHGSNPHGRAWTVGIERPVDDTLQTEHGYQTCLSLTEGGLATSGNYRNFYEQGGKKYAHTIDPHTGRPIQSDVLSATVIAPDCMTADAYATAFMVLGRERALQVLAADTSIEGYLICPSSSDSSRLEVFSSPGFARYIKE